MSGEEAIQALETAYRTQHCDAAEVGIFGNGLPDALVAATGAKVQHVHITPESDAGLVVDAIAPVLEPFLDAHVRQFLHRLFAGRFDHLSAIIFCRDDAPSLAAYQYALEIRRLGIASTEGPRLLVWNLVHKPTAAADTFNRAQLDRLWQELAAIGFKLPDAAGISAALAAEQARAQAMSRMDVLCHVARLDGARAMRWRNAGRVLPAPTHATKLNAALAEVSQAPVREGARIGLVGSLLPCTRSYDMIEQFGTITCDLQPLGTVWPLPMPQGADAQALLASAAADPFCPRIDPPMRFVDALFDRIVVARCDIVVAQVSQNDDSFGWDLPALHARLQTRGISLIDLGFRDDYPDADWLADAAQRLRAALEVTG